MREKEKTTGVIFVRHGEADFPAKRLYCDEREDPGLTERGREQARQAAEMLAGQRVDVVYASPMQRTRSTAAPIAEATGAPLHLEPRLKERPFGIWDGLYFDEIARDYPEGFRAWKQDPVHFVPEGGETINDHMSRVTGALRRIVEAHPGRLIVIVAHVGPIRMCITEALTMPLAAYRRLTIDYGSLSRVEYGEQQNNLVYLNLRRRPLP
jgi:ribonuclease H / adenosylcobalamin/alpha-ribazole phosphatase